MPRLIILLLTLASLTTLTVQNLGADKAVSLTILDRPLSPIPLGLLLLAAAGTGALITLILYGLVGLHRPATSASKSKYQPMGSRVPYPEASGSTVPPTDAGYSTAPSSTTTYGSGNTAFVTEPPAGQPPIDTAGSASTKSQASAADSTKSPTGSAQASSPAAPSNVYSPFSRNQDADAKKKGPTVK